MTVNAIPTAAPVVFDLDNQTRQSGRITNNKNMDILNLINYTTAAKKRCRHEGAAIFY